MTDRKCLPFEYEAPVMGVNTVSTELHDCGDIDELVLGGRVHLLPIRVDRLAGRHLVANSVAIVHLREVGRSQRRDCISTAIRLHSVGSHSVTILH